MVRPTEHPARYAITNELHARPFDVLTPPQQVTFYAMVTGEEGEARDKDFDHLIELCRRYGVNPPPKDAIFFNEDFGQFRLRWERHTEYTAYAFFRGGKFDLPFGKPVTEFVPDDWIAQLPGLMITAVHVVLESQNDSSLDQDRLNEIFAPEGVVSSQLAGGVARIWSDLRIHEDGFSRVLIRDAGMRRRKASRVVYRLLDIAVYRNLALLALPLARETLHEVTELESGLASLISRIDTSEEEESALLRQLTSLSARIEELSATTAYRFSATRAYYALVQNRLEELREHKVDGYQTFGEFMDRRMGPAMRTCEAVASRLSELSRRATRAANLLRTRVDFALEAQNQELLASMDQRAKIQLRLQETVEGLSVVAISYYMIGLVGYAAKAVKAAGVNLDPSLVSGLSVPIVLGLVWYGVRRAKKALIKLEATE